jgi:hypothetical protein
MSAGLVYKFPTNVEMDVTTQEYQRDGKKLEGMKILPVNNKSTTRVEWDEKDNETGKTSVHTMDTDPRIRRRPGSKTHSFEPIPRKETELVKESELLQARALGTLGGVIDLEEYVLDCFRRGMNLDDIAMEEEIWAALDGELVIDENGVKLNEEFPIQEFTPTVPWDQLATATPLKDMNAVKLMFAGTGASAEGSVAYSNQLTFNRILENTNVNDLRGFNVDNFRAATFDMEQFNKMMIARGLPMWKIYDEGYYPENSQNFKRFMRNGRVTIIGKRAPGQNVGDYILTPTLHRFEKGRPAPGRFAFMTVNGQPSTAGRMGISGEQLGQHGNPSFGVVHGFYGGPRLQYARSVVRVNAFTEG